MSGVRLPTDAVGSAFAGGCTLPPPDARERAGWHRGRRRYAVWLIEADTPEIHVLCDRARERLAPWLGRAPGRQPHITLAACGFPVRRGNGADDCDARQRRTQREALQRAAPARFRLYVGGLGSFNGCAYLRVADETGHLQALHRVLASSVAAARGQRYIPHVTLGFYRAAFPLREIAAAAPHFSERTVLPVTAVTLAYYDPRKADSPLRYALRLPLS